MTLVQGPGQRKWYKMVNGANKHGRYDQFWLISLCVMSNTNVFATEDGRPASQPEEHDCYIDPYDSHMDLKKGKKI